MKHKLETTLFLFSMAFVLSLGCTKGCSDSSNEPKADKAASQATGQATGLKIEDTKVGDGVEATPGKSITVHYTGTLTDGTKFDSSLDHGRPFTFQLGGGQVIQGWDQGLIGMKVHGKRKLTIPPEMGYGPSGQPPVIPPNATLIFDVELLEVN